MGYAAGHGLTYAAVIVGIFYIVGLAVAFMRKSWKRALKIGFTRERLIKLVKITAYYSLVPAIAILAGFFTLAPILGIPLAWWRLSIIGNTAYEIIAANMALVAAGINDISKATAREFILIIYVMSIGIMGGMVISPVLSKRIQKGAFVERKRDRVWGALSGSVYMKTIYLVFAIPMLLGSHVLRMTLLTSAAAMAALNFAIKRTGAAWLKNFSLTISMLVAMTSSVLWTRLLG
ncbi:MAG: DUF5058 family protein [Clostridiales bacterium]|jgi:hypothetical protein|nr:DUF5058 family protein [Clostridiales bacterium]